MYIVKRNGQKEKFDVSKIENAIIKAFESVGYSVNKEVIDDIVDEIDVKDGDTVEDIQELVINALRLCDYNEVADSYFLYREKHKKASLIEEKLKYMNDYSNSSKNASSLSNTDPNANTYAKNVANLEGEVYKDDNRIIQRRRMKQKLDSLYPGQDLGHQYIKDLQDNIIYIHDEASSPTLKYYCQAVSLYPLMTEGVGNMDNVTPTPPNDIQSFSGQVTNLTFLLSSQCKGAVAFSGYFVALNYYIVAEFGEHWYDKLDVVFTNSNMLRNYTIEKYILKGMKQFIYGINQAAGNRSYNSPFTNVSWFDKYYFKAMYGDFYYPDGTQPEWKAIDVLQRMFMKLMRDIRAIKPITFPVTTMSLLYDEETKEFKDKEYAKLTAEEWAKGGSFFCYMNSNPASLASCCRVLNEMDENTFSSTTGMNGEMTGSCNVITLNLNRIIQNWYKSKTKTNKEWNIEIAHKNYTDLYKYLCKILSRVYKYHIAFKTMLYEAEEQGMFASCNANYIYMKKLYSTIGLIGYMEAAEFLGFDISYNKEYIDFLSFILSTVNEQNKLNSINDKKKPFKFNSEAIPGENLGVKLYNKDKKDGYKVTEGRYRYSCYFFNPWNTNTNIFDKLALHGGKIAKSISGGQACHINLDSHLTAEQYLQIMKYSAEKGCNYFTFNIPISECKDCHHVVNGPIKECPICKSNNIKYYTRIIGYLVPVDNWSNAMQSEFEQRIYTDKTIKEI